MITVKRTNYPARHRKSRSGKEIYYPEHHECRYYYKEKEIAFYESKEDVIYLKTDYIGSDFKKSPYERAMKCKIAEAYKYLFEMFNIDKNSNISEYTNI